MNFSSITLGCATTTGGKVISSSSEMLINNAKVTLVGDIATCTCGRSSCKGKGPIVATSPRNGTVAGVQMAREGDFVDTGCSSCYLSPSPHNSGLGTEVGQSFIVGNAGAGISIGENVFINTVPMNSSSLTMSTIFKTASSVTPMPKPKIIIEKSNDNALNDNEDDVYSSNSRYISGVVEKGFKNAWPVEESIKKDILTTLKELRTKIEFIELENKYGTLTFTFDPDEKTGIIGTVININNFIFSLKYKVDSSNSANAYMESLSEDMENDAYYAAVKNYENSLPEYYEFTMKRVLVHEAYHLMQGDIAEKVYSINLKYYEGINISRSNLFMFKYYNEPFRSQDHGAAISK